MILDDLRVLVGIFLGFLNVLLLEAFTGGRDVKARSEELF